MKYSDKYYLANSLLLNTNTFVKSAKSKKQIKQEKINEILSMLLGGVGGFVAGDYMGDYIDATGRNPLYRESNGLVGTPLLMALAVVTLFFAVAFRDPPKFDK